MPDDTQRTDDGSSKTRRANELLRHSHLGLQFVLVFLFIAFLGFKADEKFGTLPLLTVLGVMVGFGLAFYQLYLAVFGERRGTRHTTGPGSDKGLSSPGETSKGERDSRG